MNYREGYKHHLEIIGDFDGGPYKHHFQNWQFDVSLLETFRKKSVSFFTFWEKKLYKISFWNFSENFRKQLY